MISLVSLKRALLMGVATVGATVSASAIAQPAYAQEVTRSYNIRAQDLNSALREFALQTGRDVLYPPGIVAGKQSPGASGQLTDTQALRAILAGTGLQFSQTTSNGFAIQATASPSQLSASDDQSAPSEEIVVTGTRLRGVAPAGSPLVVHDREDILRAGATTTDQFLRTLPENLSTSDPLTSGAGANFGASAGPNQSGVNTFNGAAANIHGMGPQATLTLVNGHRVGPAGFTGAFVDIASVPPAAIDRIEVLTDGASAIYGSDAIAGVMNLVLRTDFRGAETSASYSATAQGGGEQASFSQLLGTSWRGGQIMAAYNNTRQWEMLGGDRDYTPPYAAPSTIVPDQHRQSLAVFGRQQLSPNVAISADLLLGSRDTETVLQNFAISQSRTDGHVDNYGGTLSIEWGFSEDWQLVATGGHFITDQDYRLTTVPTVGAPSSSDNSAQIETTNFDLVADGPLFSLPAGPVRLAIGGSYRDETLTNSQLALFHTSDSLSRDVLSAFFEIHLPLVAPSNNVPLINRLDVSLAGRYDEYSDFGESFRPKVGISYEPVGGVNLRASYANAFRAATLDQLAPQVSFFAYPLPGASGTVNTLIDASGGNPDLEPETAEVFTTGIDIRPHRNGWRASATYYSIEYEDRIATPPFFFFTALTNPIAQPFIDLSPSPALVHEAFISPGFVDFTGAGEAGIGALLDLRYQNISHSNQSGIDLSAGYDWDTALGEFSANVAINHVLETSFQVIDGGPTVDFVNTLGQPPQTRGRATVYWSGAHLGFGASINFVNAYTNNAVTPNEEIDPWVTGDLQLSWRGDNFRVAINAINITDEDPPFVRGTTTRTSPGYDSTNANPFGRVLSFQISRTW